jgi:hypothetical protein
MGLLAKQPNDFDESSGSSAASSLCRRKISYLLLACCAGIALLFATTALAQVNVLTYHNDNARSGQNLNETFLTPANVNSNTFGKIGSYPVDGFVYAQPLYVSNLPIPNHGVRNVLFIATEHNTVYAFDADSNLGPTHGLLWRINLGPSALTPNNDFGNRYGPYPDIRPEIGITSTPVIDLDPGTIYVDAFTHEGTNYFHRIHALNITDGTERALSPVIVTASVPGVGIGSVGGQQIFEAKQQIQRSALTLAGGILYVAFAGYADTNPYHGWIIGFDPATLQQLPDYTFNVTPNSTVADYGLNAGEGGIWMSGGGLAVDANTNLFFETGNGIFDATNNALGGTEFGDCFLKLSTSNGLAVADYFAPYNQFVLQENDIDLGSGGLMILPDRTAGLMRTLVGAGKEGKIYHVGRDRMTTGNNHYNATGTVDYVHQTIAGQTGGSFGTPAYFNGWIFYAANGDKLKAFALNGDLLSTTPVSTGPRTFGFPGCTPSVSANGTNNGIVWTLQRSFPAVLAAYNATNLTTEIYNSEMNNRDELPAGVKFAVPVVANGKIYVGGQYAVSIFGALSGTNNFAMEKTLAALGTGILGTKPTVASGAESAVFNGGVAANINDGSPGTHVDTYNGGGTDTASFVGLLWSAPLSNSVVGLELSLATFFDGGWFGVHNAGPGSGGWLSAVTNLIEPTVQITRNGGSSWTTVPHTSDYLQVLDGHPLPAFDFGPPTLATATFHLNTPQTGITGIRIIGTEGGTASGGFLGVFELAVIDIHPAQLLNALIVEDQFQFEFDSQRGVTHVVQFKTSLSETNWQTLTTVPGDDAHKQINDTLGSTQRIYRVVGR